MPTYELDCAHCGHGFERFLTRFLREDDRVCPRCAHPGADQRISGFITARPPRGSREPVITGVAGSGCCGGRCGHG